MSDAARKGGFDPRWYQTSWASADDTAPWAQRTDADVDFVFGCAAIKRPRRILDLACGAGRHSVEMARRGHAIVGVDIERNLLEKARARAADAGVAVSFVAADVRELTYEEDFDLVVNLWEGAIGYFENDFENNRHFERIAAALKPGGHHVAGPLYNAAFIERHAPLRECCVSKTVALLSRMEWLPERRQIVDTCIEFRHEIGKPWTTTRHPPVSYRVYAPAELSGRLSAVGLRTVGFYSEPERVDGVDDSVLEYWVHSVKL